MSVAARSGLADSTAGALSYITFVPAIVFLFLAPYSSSSYVRFHAWQSIFLNVAAFVINIVLSMLVALTFFMGPIAFYALIRGIWIVWILLWILCVVQAVNGKRFKLPIIGNIAEKLAAR